MLWEKTFLIGDLSRIFSFTSSRHYCCPILRNSICSLIAALEYGNLSIWSPVLIRRELINDGDNTAPSKRIIGEIPEYEKMKPSAAPIVAEKIGLPTLRLQCKHFDEWLCRLEMLNKG